MTGLVLAAVAALGLGFAAYVRLAPSDPDRWHVDPMTAPAPARPNAWRVGPEGPTAFDATAPVYPMPPGELARQLDAIALGDGGERLAGGPDGLWTTYLHRTPRMRFPDYTSVRVLPHEAGSTVAIFARARFGRSDLGVNRARVEKWLAALAAMQEERPDSRP